MRYELLLTVRSQNATRVTVNGAPLSSGQWTMKDGSVVVTIPDRFEKTEIRIE